MRSRSRKEVLVFGVFAFAVLTAVTFPIARYRIFTGFTPHDDEGFMLVALRSFLHRGWLYDGTNGYGPFYYEFWGAVLSPFGLQVNHDLGRLLTLIVWVLSSLLIGLATWGMADSILLGLATQLSAFEALYSLVPEPMHPGGLIVLLLSAIVAVSCFIRKRMSLLPWAIIGAAIMALALIKVNVGIFAVAAVALVCVVSYPAIRRLRPLVEVSVVVLPMLLMGSRMSEGWVRHFALHVSAAVLAVVLALRARELHFRDSRELRWLLGGALLVAFVVPLSLSVAGTKPSAIVDGTILLPLRFPVLLSSELVLPSWTYLLDLFPLAGAFGYWHGARVRRSHLGLRLSLVFPALNIIVGVFMSFAVIFSITQFSPALTQIAPMSFRWGLLTFTWMALVPPPGSSPESARFAHLLLPPLAVLQALHAYPVAGSQLYWSTLLLIPVGALCISNGARWMSEARTQRPVSPQFPAIVPIAAATVISLISIHLGRELSWVRIAHDQSVAMNLPGAERIRISHDDAIRYQRIVASIERDCTSFVTLPGMSSFYLWTKEEPPIGYDPTSWTLAFDERAQRGIVEVISGAKDFCLVKNLPLTQFWGETAKSPSGPLFSYLGRGFEEFAMFGDYQLLKHKGL